MKLSALIPPQMPQRVRVAAGTKQLTEEAPDMRSHGTLGKKVICRFHISMTHHTGDILEEVTPSDGKVLKGENFIIPCHPIKKVNFFRAAAF